MTRNRTTVLITEAIIRLMPMDSRKLQKGNIREAKRTPNISGMRKGAPKYKATTLSTANKRILLIFVSLSIQYLFL
jgi:hypothetical protein